MDTVAFELGNRTFHLPMRLTPDPRANVKAIVALVEEFNNIGEALSEGHDLARKNNPRAKEVLRNAITDFRGIEPLATRVHEGLVATSERATAEERVEYDRLRLWLLEKEARLRVFYNNSMQVYDAIPVSNEPKTMVTITMKGVEVTLRSDTIRALDPRASMLQLRALDGRLTEIEKRLTAALRQGRAREPNAKKSLDLAYGAAQDAARSVHEVIIGLGATMDTLQKTPSPQVTELNAIAKSVIDRENRLIDTMLEAHALSEFLK